MSCSHPLSYRQRIITAGKGKFAIVFKATRLSDGTVVALKKVRDLEEERDENLGKWVAARELISKPR